MRTPFKNLAKFCLWLCLGVVFVFGAAAPTQAIDNDDPTVRVCSVNVGKSTFDLTQSSDPNPPPSQTAYYVRKEGTDRYFFSVKACGLESSVDNCVADGRQKVVASIGWPLGWDSFELTKRGSCYEGEIELNETGAVEARKVKLDIELSDDNGSCQKQLPLCRRVFGAVSSEHGENETDQCSLAINRFTSCNIVKFSTTEIVKDKPVNFGVSIDPILATSCVAKLKGANIIVKDPNGKEVLKEYISGAVSSGGCNSGGKFGTCNFTFTPDMLAVCDENGNGSGGYSVFVQGEDNYVGTDAPDCTLNFGVGTAAEACTPPDPADVNVAEKFQICDQIKKDSAQYEKCTRCMTGQATTDPAFVTDAGVPQGIWTAVGCIKTNPQSIVATFIKIGLGAAGGAALLMILASSFMITTSTGEAKKYNEAKEMMTNAIIGLVFIIMSVSILQFVGVSLFHIPGFGE